MSILDLAKDALKEIPMSDLLRERLSLALDQLQCAEAKLDELKAENAKLQALLEIERVNSIKVQQELQQLKEEHVEEIRIEQGVEFKRGKRTGGKWIPFCPSCHTAADTSTGLLHCAVPKCGWKTLIGKNLADIISRL